MRQHKTDWSMLREQDKTAWLDAMAGVGRHDLLNLSFLTGYLESMGRRDRRSPQPFGDINSLCPEMALPSRPKIAELEGHDCGSTAGTG